MATVRVGPNYRTGWTGFVNGINQGSSFEPQDLSDSADNTYISNWFATRESISYPQLAAYLPAGAMAVRLQSYVRGYITSLLYGIAATTDSAVYAQMVGGTITLARAEGGAIVANPYTLQPVGTDLYGPVLAWPPSWTDLANAPQLIIDAGRQALLFNDAASEYSQRITEAYILFTYATQPVVVALTPVGPQTNGNSPAYSYVYTPGDDGSAQTANQIKVFTTQAANQTGFNPETATPVWDSGQTSTSQTSGRIGTALANNGSYYIYIKAAQSINGNLHWSEWSRQAFTVQIPPTLVPPKPTLTATVDNNLARIRLTMTAGGTPSWDHVTIERSTDRLNWVPVRSAENQFAGGSTFVVWDYESGNGENVYYRAFALRINSIGGNDFEATSPQSNPAGPVAWSSPYTWLKSPTRPAFNRTVRFSTSPEEVFPVPQSVWTVPGRRNPVVVSGVRSGSRFPGCSFTTLDADASDDLLDLFMLSEPLLLQTPVKHRIGSRYVSAGSLTRGRISRLIQHDPRTFKVDLTEVDRPAGPIVAVPWTWGDVLAKYPTWQSIKDNFATWADLVGATPKSAPTPVTPPTSTGNTLLDDQGNTIVDNTGNDMTDG